MAPSDEWEVELIRACTDWVWWGEVAAGGVLAALEH